MSDHADLIAEAYENVPRDLGDWANLAVRLRDALEAVTTERDEARAQATQRGELTLRLHEQVAALQAVTPPWVIEAKALEAFVAKIRSELRETAEAGIDLGDDYLRGMRSALLQASAEAACIREENDRG